MSFYQLNNDNQQLLKEERSKFRRGFVVVRYDRSVTLLDAASYAKEEWDKVIDEAIKSAFMNF